MYCLTGAARDDIVFLLDERSYLRNLLDTIRSYLPKDQNGNPNVWGKLAAGASSYCWRVLQQRGTLPHVDLP